MLRTCRARLTHTCVRSHYAATILPRVPNALGPNNHRVLWEPRQIISGTKKRRGLVQPVRPGHATQLGAGVQTRPAQLAHSRGRVCCCTGVWHDAPAAVHIAGSKKAWCARLVPRIHQRPLSSQKAPPRKSHAFGLAINLCLACSGKPHTSTPAGI